ncbi:uncharacterized protein LACBIDRAFT_313000 [Laccaria bicolor S238N-H82]|uniref:Predicted protein n=1 Tax=Laccaria bicolor (strain S238N-H82 / ATCC MYA-4686) TaxID=486041 RepID=B0DXB5_LACBS|nr:uncharacterized protein LACBIDRAFT_313000 [Laccaria bicolor S238N-H82]EDR00762.1 predicted protein [Laccaria bicolor S238N-H82]|eukprot:XP_001888554.1 predicted protein [Laccaria bicolor S238N-H82]
MYSLLFFPLAPHINHYVISSPLFSFSSYRILAIPRVEIRWNQARAAPDLPDFGYSLITQSVTSPLHHAKPRHHWRYLTHRQVMRPAKRILSQCGLARTDHGVHDVSTKNQKKNVFLHLALMNCTTTTLLYTLVAFLIR